jgi:hypothetical protein
LTETVGRGRPPGRILRGMGRNLGIEWKSILEHMRWRRFAWKWCCLESDEDVPWIVSDGNDQENLYEKRNIRGVLEENVIRH